MSPDYRGTVPQPGYYWCWSEDYEDGKKRAEIVLAQIDRSSGEVLVTFPEGGEPEKDWCLYRGPLRLHDLEAAHRAGWLTAVKAVTNLGIATPEEMIQAGMNFGEDETGGG